MSSFQWPEISPTSPLGPLILPAIALYEPEKKPCERRELEGSVRLASTPPRLAHVFETRKSRAQRK